MLQQHAIDQACAVATDCIAVFKGGRIVEQGIVRAMQFTTQFPHTVERIRIGQRRALGDMDCHGFVAPVM
ncbi:hypothetical protein WS48_16915 [Burkholderia sp. RF7-non_BP1]|nr:hypothetical protein WS46_19685 [Burkholderia sp. RF4-BP95]KUY96156.1 hypothetical protein WS48_16915 [Burkholderia sp. RF7-non_BP1]